MEPINQMSQERKAYDPPAVVYETELEVHAVSSQSTVPPIGGSFFEPLDLDKK